MSGQRVGVPPEAPKRLAGSRFALLMALCLAAAGSVAAQPVSPSAAVSSVPLAPVVQKNQTPALAAPGGKDDADLKDRMKVLEERERAMYLMVIEEQRKKVDWWLTAIGVVLAALGVVGVLIPFVWTRSERERLKQAQEEADKLLKDAQQTLSQIQAHEDAASRALKGAEESAASAKAASDKALDVVKSSQSGEQITDAQKAEQQQASTAVLAEPKADDLSKLRALAVKAADSNKVEQASMLWQAVAGQAPTDALALFNAAYWLARQLEIDQNFTTKDLRKVSSFYSAHTQIDTQSHWGFNNWGSALAEEAQALAASDLPEACRLWQQAGQKFAQALSIKADMHEAANNWGIALGKEAQALAASDLPEARGLWQQAGQKYEQALSIKADQHDAANSWGAALLYETHALRSASADEQVEKILGQACDLLLQHGAQYPDSKGQLAYNLACVYAGQDKVSECMAQLEVSRIAGRLPDRKHLENDQDLALIRAAPEFQAWWQRHFS